MRSRLCFLVDARSFITGQSDRKAYGVLLLIIVISTIGLFFTIAALYSIPITFRTHAISNLGNPKPNYNPRGWWLFTLLFVAMAIFILPYVVYIAHGIPFPRLWLGLMGLSCAGLALVGIFNESLGAIHYVGAVMAFSGAGIGAIVYLPIFIRVIVRKSGNIHPIPFSLLYCYVLVFLAIIIREVVTYGISKPSDLNFTEWMALFLLLGWIFGLYFVVEPPAGNIDAIERG